MRLSVCTGCLLLFSAGTFLYVATVHVLPGIYNDVTARSVSIEMDGFGDHNEIDDDVEFKGGSGLRRMEVCVMVCGIFTPFVLSMGHEH